MFWKDLNSIIYFYIKTFPDISPLCVTFKLTFLLASNGALVFAFN
jgi:hypothetical protein